MPVRLIYPGCSWLQEKQQKAKCGVGGHWRACHRSLLPIGASFESLFVDWPSCQDDWLHPEALGKGKNMGLWDLGMP
jgi:hypothetical protein